MIGNAIKTSKGFHLTYEEITDQITDSIEVTTNMTSTNVKQSKFDHVGILRVTLV